MGMLVKGVWHDEDPPAVGSDGSFVRLESAVYCSRFKCNLRQLADYHNLSNYTRDIYQMPGVAETVDIPRIKLGYHGGMRNLNPSGITPHGPELDFSAPHDRGRLAKAA